MTLIDTSAWIDFLRRTGCPEVKSRVADLIAIGAAAHCGPIEFELRTGAKSRELGDLETALSFSTDLDFTRECWCRAAVLEKTLRSKGVTVPRDDVFVAAAALFYDVTLLTADPHFELMRTRGRIKLRLV